jgi:hypothetical protein
VENLFLVYVGFWMVDLTWSNYISNRSNYISNHWVGVFFLRKNVKTRRGNQLWRRENHRSKWWSFQHGMVDYRRENYIWLQCNYFCFWNLVATKTSNPNFRCLKMGKWDLRTWLF